jgi:hypothetical protein
MTIKTKLSYLGFVSLLLIGIFSVLNPGRVNALIYVGVFLLMYIFFTLLLLIIIELAYPAISGGKAVFLSVVLSFGPTVAIGLSTLTEITALDIVLALGTPALICWYVVSRGFVK